MIRIFRVLVPASVLVLFLAETILIFACYAAAAYLDPDLDVDIFLVDESGFFRIAIVVILIVFGLYFQNLYSQIRPQSTLVLVQQLSLVLGLVFLSQALLVYWNRDFGLPRKLMLLGTLMALLALLAIRLLFSAAIRHAVRVRRVLFLGRTSTVERLAEHFSSHPELGLAPIGYLDSPEAPPPPVSLPRLGDVCDLARVIEDHVPHWLVIGKSEHIPPSDLDDFLELRFGGIRSERAASLYENTFGRVAVEEVQPERLILDDTLEPSGAGVALQSVYSFLLTLVAVLVTAPLFLIVALLLRIGSAGSVFSRDERVGLLDRNFVILGFRCTNKLGETTALGCFLRRTGLARLPRLFNVLRGDMSLVGPHPIRPEFAARLNELIPFFSQRHAVRPGLTGWARISMPDYTATADVLQLLSYDLHYVANCSPAFDFLILLTTIRGAFSRRSPAEVRPDRQAELV